MWNLSVAGKSIVFKTVAISKIVHLALVKVIPNSIILELDQIKKHVTWKNGSPKIRQDTLCNEYENGGLKNVDITVKIKSLHCSWFKQLYDNSAHDWKLIPLHIITRTLGKHFYFRLIYTYIQTKSENFLKIIKKCYQNAAVIYQYLLRPHLL